MAQTPDVYLFGKLDQMAGESSDAGLPEPGTVEIALCGYGSQVADIPGEGSIGRLSESIDVFADGTWNAYLFRNSVIEPEGTYYTVTVKDSNGDIAQVKAFQINDAGSFPFDSIDPIDPDQPPPVIPTPPPTSELQILGAADNMVFDGADYTAFSTVLGGDVTQPFIENMVPGNLYTFIIVQDGNGLHKFIWPTNVHNATLIDPRANATTIQTFVCDQNHVLWAIGPGTSYL